MKLIVGQIKQQAVLLAIALLVQLGALGVSLYQPVVVQELFASVLAGALPAGALAQLGSRLGAGLGVDVQQQHFSALRHQLPRSGQAKAGAAAGDEEYGVFDTQAQSSNR